ncbi:hypothetical protein ABEK63_25150, partial [Klebsiella pneumoniae]
MHILFSHFSTADPKNTTAGGGCLNLRFSEITGTDGRSAGKRLQKKGTVAKLAMRQPFVLFKGLTFQKLCL